MGPGHARRAIEYFDTHQLDFGALRNFRPPPAATNDWPRLCALLLMARRVERVR